MLIIGLYATLALVVKALPSGKKPEVAASHGHNSSHGASEIPSIESAAFGGKG